MSERPPLAIATSSLNPFPARVDPPYDLVSKLRAIAHAGFRAIELAFPDFLSFATKRTGCDVDSKDWDVLCDAAKEVHRECEALGLKIVMLQPFGNFEGWDTDKEEGKEKREDAMERAKGWIRIMKNLGTDMLQVGSTDSICVKTDKARLAADLAQLADMLAEHNMCLAYENWCWSTVATSWSEVYEIVKQANRPNIGLCLDTFQTAGGEWGDPTTVSGHIEGISKSALEERYLNSLQQLAKTIPAEKIYILQVSDAYRPQKPLDPQPDKDGLRPRGRWSGAFRPMPGTEGGYLPVKEMAQAVIRSGFRSWFSIEIFDGGPNGNGRKLGDMKEEAENIMSKSKQFVEEVFAS